MTGVEFRRIRLALGWSVAKCAEELALSQQSIYKYEEGKRNVTPRAAKLMEIWLRDTPALSQGR